MPPYRYHFPLHVPQPEVLETHATSVLAYAEQGKLQEHIPDVSAWEKWDQVFWKALDLMHVAIDLSGRVVWNVNDKPGGASIATTPELATTFLRSGGGSHLTSAVIEANMGSEQGTYPSTRMLIALGSGISKYVSPARHNAPKDIHPDERVTSSMRLSHFDPVSQKLVRAIFGLPEDFDKEFISSDPLPQRRSRGYSGGSIGKLRRLP